MPTTRAVATDNATFHVSELSLAELHRWYQNLLLPGGPCDPVDEFALPDISLKDLALICRCEVAAFDSLTGRELDLIAAAARELNPHFFKLRALVAETTGKIMETLIQGLPATPEEVA